MDIGSIPVQEVDSITRAIYLEVPPGNIVLLQGPIDIEESLAVIRTLDAVNSQLVLYTTVDMLPVLLEMLWSLREKIMWRPGKVLN